MLITVLFGANRIEAGGCEISEIIVTQAMSLAHTHVKNIVDAQIHARSTEPVSAPKPLPYVLTVEDKAYLVREFVSQAKEVYRSMSGGKDGRGQLEGKYREAMAKQLREDSAWGSRHVVERNMAVDFVSYTAFREVLLESTTEGSAQVEGAASTEGQLDELAKHKAARRVDGRAANQLRPISCQADVLPVVHGSAYFTRGDTHLLSTVTLASVAETKLSMAVDYEGKPKEENFFLHYDFPPYCTGELGNVTAVNRRMIGHGKLAEKALRYVLPSFADFPYTVRVFGECTSSNGSSSMAAVCAGSVAMLDAGVPLKGAVGGVSVGLVSSPDQSKHLLLKDIIGSEDHYGDMDFKVAGTRKGVTAIQLDVKLEGGVPLHFLVSALKIAKEGRLEILQHLQGAVTKDIGLKAHAPRAELIKIDATRVDHLVGPRGDTIKFLQKAFNVDIELREDLSVYVYGQNAAAVKEARGCIEDIAVGLKPGTWVLATVMQVQDFGAIVRINRAGEGFVHISDFSHDQDILKQPVSAVLQPGHRFRAKVRAILL
ncbi:S1 RNA-binding domain-containing protein [archaeon]|nr:MAG: S1 RNA-binding domain-containing protein [archaeon]